MFVAEGKLLIYKKAFSPSGIPLDYTLHSFRIKLFGINHNEAAASASPRLRRVAGWVSRVKKGCIIWFVIFPVLHRRHEKKRGWVSFLCKTIIQIDTSKPKSHWHAAQQEKSHDEGITGGNSPSLARSYFKVNWNSRKFPNGESLKIPCSRDSKP